MNRWLSGSLLVGMAAALLMGACTGTSSKVGSMTSPDGGMMPDGAADPDGGAGKGGSMMPDASAPDASNGQAGQVGGGEVCQPGDSKPAGDGCNTCSCEKGEWLCTRSVCGCTEETRPKSDSCNTCSCVNGTWSCTTKDCGGVCKPGDTMAGDCTSCVCADFGQGGTWACTENSCPQPECKDGEIKPSGDTCNTCQCMNGQWACTMKACPKCNPFNQLPADDSCNVCTCLIDGTWSCTDLPCPCTQGQVEPRGDGCNSCTCFATGWRCTTDECLVGCKPGMASCDGDPANGCEVNITSSVMNCGGCGLYCAMAGAYSTCVNGLCTLGNCTPGFGNCNGDPDDGCEAAIGPGGCEARCSVPNSAPAPGPATGDCECPKGTACVRNSAMNPTGDYCYLIPEGCKDGYAQCFCMQDCACPNNPGEYCADEMAPGGVFNIACRG